MTTIFKITAALLEQLREDLRRPHDFAAERVGFLSCRVAKLTSDGVVILAGRYHPLDDHDYANTRSVGAMMNSEAIRKALQIGYNDQVGLFHVHMHSHAGIPVPSTTDLRETAKFVPDFWNVRPEMPHGALIVSKDWISGRCWYPGDHGPKEITEFVIVGPQLVFKRNSKCTND